MYGVQGCRRSCCACSRYTRCIVVRCSCMMSMVSILLLQDFSQKRKLKGRMESTVLEPCRIALDFTLQAPEGGAGRLVSPLLMMLASWGRADG